MLPLSVIVRDYLCAVCQSHLKGAYDFDESKTVVVCAADPTHFGLWRKTYHENRQTREKLEAWDMMHDPMLRMMYPWIPAPERVSVEQAVAELYG